jgi:hypothetical protein
MRPGDQTACWRRSGRVIIGANWLFRHIVNEIEGSFPVQGGLTTVAGNANDSINHVCDRVVFDTQPSIGGVHDVPRGLRLPAALAGIG